MKNADNLTDRYKLSINLIRLIVGAILGCGAFTIFASRGSLMSDGTLREAKTAL